MSAEQLAAMDPWAVDPWRVLAWVAVLVVVPLYVGGVGAVWARVVLDVRAARAHDLVLSPVLVASFVLAAPVWPLIGGVVAVRRLLDVEEPAAGRL